MNEMTSFREQLASVAVKQLVVELNSAPLGLICGIQQNFCQQGCYGNTVNLTAS